MSVLHLLLNAAGLLLLSGDRRGTTRDAVLSRVASELVMPPPDFIRLRGDEVLLAVKVQSRAAENAIVGTMGAELKVRIQAPPVDSAANQALIHFLAGWLGCPRRQVKLIRGLTSPHKVLSVTGVPWRQVVEKLRGDAEEME